MSGLFFNTFELALVAAPWLVLGLVCAGLLRGLVPPRLVGPALGGSGFKPVLRAAIIGAPLPLCSCGVLPTAFALRRAGASRAATSAFLVATPETGADSVALSWVLLGPLLAIVRPLAAVFSAVCAGLLVGRLADDEAPLATVAPPTCGDHAHSQPSAPQHEPAVMHWTARSAAGIRWAFSDLLDDLLPWLAVGTLLAGLLVTVLPPSALAAWGSGPVAMLLMLLVSVPMYVCASAATPLAHAMLHAGVSPGTVLVFLLAGPATNIAGMVLIKRELGVRALVAYLLGVCGAALAVGITLDAAWPWLASNVLAGHVHDHEHGAFYLAAVSIPSLALLCVMAVRPLRRRLIGTEVGHPQHQH